MFVIALLILSAFFGVGLIMLFLGERIVLWWYKVGIYVTQKMGILPEPPELIMSRWLDTPFHKAAMLLFKAFGTIVAAGALLMIILALYGLVKGN